MKTKIAHLFSISSIFIFSTIAHAGVNTVPYVDVSRYLGDWYQISHIPLWFEGPSDCGCARQRLSPTSQPGTIGVLNTCTKTDGSPDSISGYATDDDKSSNAKFTVSFEGVPFKGSYWIIGLDSNYRFAVVTNKGGDALYILSRSPVLPSTLYDEAVSIAAKQIDVTKLVKTKQLGCTYPK
jgi:apolipoprotein D and lipocalin family protein